MNEQQTEQEIQRKGLNAPRLTPDLIDAQIVAERYITGDQCYADAPDGQRHVPSIERALSCLTICVLVLRNGYTLVGKSACASPENFDAILGQKIAREDARRQIWALEGYALKSRLTGAAP